jgi:hypothetical protein
MLTNADVCCIQVERMASLRITQLLAALVALPWAALVLAPITLGVPYPYVWYEEAQAWARCESRSDTWLEVAVRMLTYADGCWRMLTCADVC